MMISSSCGGCSHDVLCTMALNLIYVHAFIAPPQTHEPVERVSIFLEETTRYHINHRQDNWYIFLVISRGGTRQCKAISYWIQSNLT